MKKGVLRSLTLVAAVALLAVTAGAKAFMGVYPGNEVDLEKRGYDGSGLMINDIVADGPAEKAGMLPGDVLIRFEGKELSDNEDLGYFLRKKEKGDKVELTIFRDGKEKKLKLTLDSSKNRKNSWTSIDFEDNWRKKRDKQGFLGVTTIELSDELLASWKVKEGYGLLVNTVIKGTAAARDGIQAGDVLIEFDGSPIYSSSRLGRLCRRLEPGSEVEIRLLRSGKMLTEKIKIGKRSDVEDGDFGFFGNGPEDQFDWTEGLAGLESLKHLEHLEHLGDMDFEIHHGDEDVIIMNHNKDGRRIY